MGPGPPACHMLVLPKTPSPPPPPNPVLISLGRLQKGKALTLCSSKFTLQLKDRQPRPDIHTPPPRELIKTGGNGGGEGDLGRSRLELTTVVNLVFSAQSGTQDHRILCSLGWSPAHYVAKAGLRLRISLSLPSSAGIIGVQHHLTCLRLRLRTFTHSETGSDAEEC